MKLLGKKLVASSPLPGAELFTPELRKLVRERRGLRRADRYTLLAAAAAFPLVEALETPPPGDDTALLTVTAFGPHATVFATLDDILDYPEDEILPTKFSHSVHNAAASYLCAALNIRGPVFALNGMENGFYEALFFAETLLADGMARAVLLVGIEEGGLLPGRAPEFAPERFHADMAEGALALLLGPEEGPGAYGTLRLAATPERPFRKQAFAFGVGTETLTELAAAGPESTVVWP